MMIFNQSPINFQTTIEIENIKIEYSRLMEICQGGPEIGDLSINESIIPYYRFGGPLLFDNGSIYAPIFIKRFCIAKFKLSIINVHTQKIRLIGKYHNIMHLDKIDNGKIYFFADLAQSLYDYYEI